LAVLWAEFGGTLFHMGALGTDGGNPLAAFLLLGATLCIFGASYAVCYTFFMSQWEGWESWNRRTGLDGDRAAEEALQRRDRQ